MLQFEEKSQVNQKLCIRFPFEKKYVSLGLHSQKRKPCEPAIFSDIYSFRNSFHMLTELKSFRNIAVESQHRIHNQQSLPKSVNFINKVGGSHKAVKTVMVVDFQKEEAD